MLFPSQKMSKAFITDPKTGFNDWRKLSPRIPDHKNTFNHKSNGYLVEGVGARNDSSHRALIMLDTALIVSTNVILI